MLVTMFARAEVEIAENADDVRRFLEENQDNTVALLFIDSSLNEGSEGGFWKGVVSSVSHIFSGEGDKQSSKQTVAEIEKEIQLLRDSGSNEAALMQIDVSNEDLREIQESYDVTTVPFLIVFKRGIVVLKEVPTHETHDKILQVLNVNPAASHDEPESATTPTAIPVEEEEYEEPEEEVDEEPEEEEEPEEVEEPEEEEDEDWEPEEEDEYEDEEEETPEEPTAASVPTSSQPVAARSEPTLTTVPPPTPATAAEKPQKITLAPGERQPPQIVEARQEAAPSDARRKFVHHQCHDVTTYDDNKAANWRNSPFYISELEDYEIPEDWWRNGYSPLNETAANATQPTTRQVSFSEPEVIVYEPSAPPVFLRPEPVVVVEPLRRPEPVIIAEPAYRPEHLVRPVAYEPRYASHHHVVRGQPTNTTVVAHQPSQTQVRETVGTPSAPVQVSRREVPAGQNGAPTVTTTQLPRAPVRESAAPRPVSQPTTTTGARPAPQPTTTTTGARPAVATYPSYTSTRTASPASTQPAARPVSSGAPSSTASRPAAGPTSSSAPRSGPSSASQVTVPPQGAQGPRRR